MLSVNVTEPGSVSQVVWFLQHTGSLTWVPGRGRVRVLCRQCACLHSLWGTNISSLLLHFLPPELKKRIRVNIHYLFQRSTMTAYSENPFWHRFPPRILTSHSTRGHTFHFKFPKCCHCLTVLKGPVLIAVPDSQLTSLTLHFYIQYLIE